MTTQSISKNPFQRLYLILKILVNLVRIAKNPQDTKAALAIGPHLLKLGLLENSRQYLAGQKELPQFIEKRYLLPVFDIDQLAQKNKTSLAYHYSQHMLSNNLRPDFFQNIPITNDASYFMMRMRQTHDLWHSVTGFTTKVEDEIGLLSFTFAQTRAPLAPLLIGASVIKAGLKGEERLSTLFDRISLGWKMGTQAKPLFCYDWEKNWDKDLVEVRNELNIQPIT